MKKSLKEQIRWANDHIKDAPGTQRKLDHFFPEKKSTYDPECNYDDSYDTIPGEE